MSTEHTWRISRGAIEGKIKLGQAPRHTPRPPATRKLGGRWLFMAEVVVDQQARGRGWAHLLLDAAVRWADRNQVSLWTYVQGYDNGPPDKVICKLYRQYGFKKPVDSEYRYELVRLHEGHKGFTRKSH
jgi:GNAT superfamily N-acetyltransferase